MRIVYINLYRYDELSEGSKERAFRDSKIDSQDLFEDVARLGWFEANGKQVYDDRILELVNEQETKEGST